MKPSLLHFAFRVLIFFTVCWAAYLSRCCAVPAIWLRPVLLPSRPCTPSGCRRVRVPVHSEFDLPYACWIQCCWHLVLVLFSDAVEFAFTSIPSSFCPYVVPASFRYGPFAPCRCRAVRVLVHSELVLFGRLPVELPITFFSASCSPGSVRAAFAGLFIARDAKSNTVQYIFKYFESFSNFGSQQIRSPWWI